MQDFFHVHTWRCKHASDETDQEIIEKAISLGAKKITFTDHVPFPENPFGNRMDFEQLEEYLETLSSLKEKYQNQIDVKIGFEVEFVPKYLDYFKQLKKNLPHILYFSPNARAKLIVSKNLISEVYPTYLELERLGFKEIFITPNVYENEVDFICIINLARHISLRSIKTPVNKFREVLEFEVQ